MKTAGIEHSVALITTRKWPKDHWATKISPKLDPKEESVEFGSSEDLLRDEVWGTKDLPLFISEITRGTKERAKIPQLPSVIEWDGQLYETYQESMPAYLSGFIHSHSSPSPDLSIGDWSQSIITHRKVNMVVHRDVNHVIVRTEKSRSKYATYYADLHGDTERSISDLPPLTRQQKKDFMILLMSEKDVNRWYIKTKPSEIAEWEKRICTLLDLGLYRGKPNEPVIRVA